MRHFAHQYPIEDPLSPEDVEVLQNAGVTASLLRKFPVDGPFTLAEAKELAHYDIDSVLNLMRSASVDEPFAPDQALEVARGGSYPHGEFDDDGPLSVDEFIRRLR